MCLICDSYLLKYFLALINISINAPEHKVLLSKIVLNRGANPCSTLGGGGGVILINLSLFGNFRTLGGV